MIKIIDKAIYSSTFCKANKHSNQKINGVSIEEFNNQVKADWNKVNDLIKRRNAIKQAVVLSNARTEVEIGDKKYTVAEAIEMKNSGMQYKKNLLEQLMRQYEQQLVIIEKENKGLEEKAEHYVVNLYGSKESKTSNDEIEKTKKQFVENNTFELVDPIHIKEQINKLEQEISEFMAEVDSKLSVSNALTEIKIEY